MNPDKSMQRSRNKKLILLIIIVFMVLGGSYVIWRGNNKQSSKSTNQNSTETVLVTITKDGFVPSTQIVKPNTAVKWMNADTKPHQVGSTPYPTHKDLPNFNSKNILPGESYTYTFTDIGNFKYYDGNELKNNGVVDVQ